MTTPGLFQDSKTPRLVLGVCALAGIVLMGVPCGRSESTSTGSPDEGPPPTVTASFVPSNVRVDPDMSAADAATLVLEGVPGTFVFAGGQQWLDYEDGTARLVAELADLEDRERRFELNLRAMGLGKRLDDVALLLDQESYSEGGGAIDPALWRTFGVVEGSLTGLRDLTGLYLTFDLSEGGVLQIGEGANNANPYFGAYAPLDWSLESGNGLPEGGTGTLSFTLQADTISRPSAALSELPYNTQNSRHAVTIPGIARPLVFSAGGQLTESPDGTARLAGVLVNPDDPGQSFHMDVRLSGRIDPGDEAFPPEGSPKLELTAASYLENGGTIDPEAWYYYENFSGTLVGLRDMAGATLEVTRRGPAFQFGLGASGKNSRLGGAGWLTTTVLTQPTSGATLGDTGGDINIDLDGSGVASCALPANRDEELSRYSGGHAFWLPSLATDFVFEPGARFVERADGTARLTGEIVSASDDTLRFLATVDLADRVDPQGPGHAPAGSPKLELRDGAYVENGGAVDPAGWHYYGTFGGELIGLARMKGAVIEIERRGPAFQFGLGASGKNQRYGGSGWLEVSVVAHPLEGNQLPAGLTYGDINIDLQDDCSVCASSANSDSAVTDANSFHAFWLPGIAEDFVFEPGARFVELGDGTASLTGVIQSPSRGAGWRFLVDVSFESRVDPGDANYPPVGSPKREMPTENFSDHGGPIDVDSWRYYETFQGTLRGLDDLEGAIVNISRFGPAMQVGPGGSGKNHDFGTAAWLDVTLEAQPTTGIALPGTLGRGDFNLNLMGECEDCAIGAPADPEVSRLSGNAAFYLAGLEGTWFDFDGAADFVERGDGTARLAGVLVGREGSDNRWELELEFRDRFDPLLGDPLPADSPKRDLIADRFIDSGGPVDFGRWRYYTETIGELRGLGQHEGAVVRLWRMGPSFQVGHGASGRNENYGASGWLHTEVLSQPTAGPAINVTSGDFNVDLGTGCDLCASPAMLGEGVIDSVGDFGFFLPGIGIDFIFEGNAPFDQFPDGTARMTGEIYRPQYPAQRFQFEVTFEDYSAPGMANYPPPYSPKLQLPASFYAESGGAVDPSDWTYYESFVGRLIGMGDFAGGEIRFTRMGEAFQIGAGANGKNVNFGGSGWLDLEIISHPDQGDPFTLDENSHGDINVDLGDGCR